MTTLILKVLEMILNERGGYIVIPTRERCQICGVYNPVGFYTPDAMWKEVCPPHYQNSIICLLCFTKAGDEKLLPWEEGLELYPVSLITLDEARRNKIERPVKLIIELSYRGKEGITAPLLAEHAQLLSDYISSLEKEPEEPRRDELDLCSADVKNDLVYF